MHHPLNILMVTLAYAPAIAFGGPVTVVQNNARELVRRGHRVTVYCTNRLDKERKLASSTIEGEDRGVRVVYHNTCVFPGWNGNFGPTFSPGMAAYLLKEGRNFDLIHIHEARAFTTLLAGFFAQTWRIPYIIQAHGSFTYGLRAQRLKRFYDKMLGNKLYCGAAKIIVSQEDEITECEAVGIDRHKIIIMGNGINLADWQINKKDGILFRERFSIPGGASLLFFLSRLDKKKGPDLLVEALAQLDDPDVYCIMAGPDDGYMEYVQRLVGERGLLSRVIFTGLLEGADVNMAYAAADVFVHPARFDTFPMAVVKACASGLPILTTETCQIANFIKNRAGLVTAVNPDSLSEGLRQLLADQEQRGIWGRGARELAETEFSISTIADQLENIYRQILGECRK